MKIASRKINGNIDEAKLQPILIAILCAVLLVVFFAIFFAVSAPAFAQDPLAGPIVPRCPDGGVCGFKELGEMFVKVLSFVIAAGIALSVIVFAYAGFLYLTAAGNPGQIEKAHKMFIKVIIGFIIALSAFIIVDMIAGAFKLAGPIKTLYDSFVQ